MPTNGPLSAYRVLEIGSGAGAMCGRMLAELGASVTKMEPPAGDPMRTQAPAIDGTGISFAWYNANKELGTADIQSAAGVEAIRSSLANFDVLIDGNQPGWLAEHGLDPAKLRRRFPRLIITSVSHFGQTGPYRDWHGSALVDFAMSGSLLRCGLPTEAPCGPPYQLPYVVAGVAAACATTAALWDRGRTGEGDWLDCSVLEVLIALADWSVPGTSVTGQQTKRSGAGPLFRLYRASDGWVRVINLSVKQWRAVQAWLGNPPEIAGPEWDNPLFRAANMKTLDEVFGPRFASRTVRDLFEDGQANGVGVVPIYSPAEVMADRHFRERQAFSPFTMPSGARFEAPSGFVRMGNSRPSGVPSPTAVEEGSGVRVGGRIGDTHAPPLAGIRVVELGSGAVGPEIARVLGVLGADVVKIESRAQIDFMRLQGVDIESSPGWSSSNRNKRSVRLDLKTAEGRKVALKLAASADVIVENNTAGVMDRLDIGYAAVSALNPAIVYVSSQAFGANGPYSTFGGFGPTNQAVSGTTYLWNHPDPERPEGTQVIHPDHILGRMGAMAAIAALEEVRNGGPGQQIDLSQSEFAIACIGEAFIEASAGLDATARGNRSPIGSPHGVFPCAGEDQWIAITIDTDEQWKRLAAVVAEPSWAGEKLCRLEERLADRDVIEAQLAAWTSQSPPVQLQRRLQAAGVPAGALYSVLQVMADVHLAERGFFSTVVHPSLGAMRMEGIGYKAERMEHSPDARAPLFGEHTREVLTEWLGLESPECEALEAAGAFN